MHASRCRPGAVVGQRAKKAGNASGRTIVGDAEIAGNDGGAGIGHRCGAEYGEAGQF